MENLTIELVSLAMKMAEHKQKVATINIAQANMSNSIKQDIDFDGLLAQIKNTMSENRLNKIESINAAWGTVVAENTEKGAGEIEVDHEVAKSMLASGEFVGLTEGLNRKLGLLRIAINGGK